MSNWEYLFKCRVPDSVESFTEVEGKDNDKLFGGEEVGDGMKNGD